jgi:hypothetical protein
MTYRKMRLVQCSPGAATTTGHVWLKCGCATYVVKIAGKSTLQVFALTAKSAAALQFLHTPVYKLGSIPYSSLYYILKLNNLYCLCYFNYTVNYLSSKALALLFLLTSPLHFYYTSSLLLIVS